MRSTIVLALILVSATTSRAESPGADASMAEVQVTATRIPRPVRDVPADVTVLSSEDIEQSGTLTLDDALRSLPDFNTFRRSSSVVTAPAEDPEAQGVSLRGIGPGGASRALVLVDGIPVNDPFGGWIYWGELPLASIDRIDVVRGGSSNVWGNFALGGVINVITKPLEPGVFDVLASGGNRSITRDAVSYSSAWVEPDHLAPDEPGPVRPGRLRLGIRGDILHSGGWNIVARNQRGPIDEDADLDSQNVAGRAEYPFGDGGLLFFRSGYYDEGRGNGTPFRESEARRLSLVGGGKTPLLGGELDAAVFSHVSRMRQTFSVANVARTAETPTQIQRVPAQDAGGSVVWSRPVFTRDLLTVGADVRLVSGRSRDAFFDDAGVTIDDRRTSRGQQRFVGVFAQEVLPVSDRLDVAAGVRVDHFASFDGRMLDARDQAPTTVTRFPDRRATPVSPRLDLRYHVADGVALRGAGYQAFRAPTLAELYRRSSVEGLVLAENPRLRPEVLDGGELGIDYLPAEALDLHLTGFWNDIHDAISAITTAFDPVTGEDSRRTRVNLGLARVRGVESEASGQVGRHVRIFGRYIYSEALVLDAPDPDLEGKRLTQVPQHAGVVGVRYADDRYASVLLQTRIESRKFEDADNHDALGGYYVVDASVSRALPPRGLLRGGSVFLSAQNLTDRSYEVDKGGGITKIGTPLVVAVGVNLRF